MINNKLKRYHLLLFSTGRYPVLNFRCYVTGEKLWFDRGSNPGPFADRANTTTELPSHPVNYHQQLFSLTLPSYSYSQKVVDVVKMYMN